MLLAPGFRDFDQILEEKSEAIRRLHMQVHELQEAIRGTVYCVASLEAALWCFHHHDTFEEVVLAAANLGDDADTTAAIAGQIAGAHYGVAGIPAGWLEKLHWHDEIARLATALWTA